MYDTHVYLGPSLSVDIANTLLPQAHYHPPIQCGDIIRLLRLNPKKIIIIDGLYETVPAVWHKEIMIALCLGIEVWGAASMGALRAAELYPYGMQGWGSVYEDFKTGKLNDDDEVAVLHKGKTERFAPVNDAMVNIRATCDYAYLHKLLTLEEKNTLLNACKQQFYPYRSLHNAILQLDEKTCANKHQFAVWLETHGLIDVKKQDAMGVLSHHHGRPLAAIKQTPVAPHLTVFIRELIQYACIMPFPFHADWLPPIEKQLHALYQQVPQHYMLVAELAYFTRKLYSVKPNLGEFNNSELDGNFIQQHGLYSPESDFKTYSHTPELANIYALVCRMICQNRVTQATIDRYLPIITHYYDINPTVAKRQQRLLRVLLLLVLSINTHSNRTRVQVSDSVVINHCQEVMRRRKYSQDTFRDWFHPSAFKHDLFVNFLMHYLMSLRNTHYRSETQPHYHWIYDAYLFYADNELNEPADNLTAMEELT